MHKIVIIGAMEATPIELPNDVAVLHEMVTSLQERVLTLEGNNQYLLEQFRLSKHKMFGRSAEAYPGQGELFNEAEQALDSVESITPEKEEIRYTRNKPKRKPLPKDIPREVIIHDLSDEEKICDCCGDDLHQMGKEISEQLEFIPAKIKVIENVRLKYSCRTCEKNNTRTAIKIAPVPVSPIPKSMATPSLLGQIIVNKYQFSLPLYRQESFFKQYQIELNRKTMAEWMIRCSILFKPIIDYWRKNLLKQVAIHADETTLNVLAEEKLSYMWLYCTGTDSPADLPSGEKRPNIVLYDYQNTRRASCAVSFLQGFKGYLQVDGYAGYEKTTATLVGCWAHARRKFDEALKLQAKNKTGKANWALSHIQKLYRIEREIKALTIEERHAIREQKSLPLLAQYKEWLDKSILQVPPKSAIGKAISYSLNQWDKLSAYTKDGHLNIDNNRAERAVKPFVIGRKNWMFANSTRGAQASATLYSVIQTAKANGVIPIDYLIFLLSELPKKTEDLEPLMPWNFKPI